MWYCSVLNEVATEGLVLRMCHGLISPCWLTSNYYIATILKSRIRFLFYPCLLHRSVFAAGTSMPQTCSLRTHSVLKANIYVVYRSSPREVAHLESTKFDDK